MSGSTNHTMHLRQPLRGHNGRGGNVQRTSVEAAASGYDANQHREDGYMSVIVVPFVLVVVAVVVVVAAVVVVLERAVWW
eukprot:6490621-Amphidinium_carterae.1